MVSKYCKLLLKAHPYCMVVNYQRIITYIKLELIVNYIIELIELIVNCTIELIELIV